MIFRRLIVASCSFLLFYGTAAAQTDADTVKDDSLMNLLADDDSTSMGRREYVAATFKATRIINGHSIENLGQGVLDFRITHRFGSINQGLEDFFGLDGATTKLGFDYGVTPWLMIGVGRSTYQKEVDGFFKAKLLRQTEDSRMPVSISVVGAAGIQTTKAPPVPAGTEYFFSNRVAYTSQVLIARKFSNWLSLQLTPSFVHYNLVPLQSDPNNVFAIGLGGRIKLTKRLSLTGEYYYTLPGAQLGGSRNALSLGVDIETGGHVFQLMFTNSTGQSERTFIGQTTGDWGAGDIHFGFNISRVFTIVKPKGMEGSRNKIW